MANKIANLRKIIHHFEFIFSDQFGLFLKLYMIFFLKGS